jgi:hypothetical protein
MKELEVALGEEEARKRRFPFVQAEVKMSDLERERSGARVEDPTVVEFGADERNDLEVGHIP